MFKLNSDVWLKITKKMLTKKDNGILADKLIKSGDCLLCGTKAEEGFVPLIFDREHLVFRTKCCSVQGGLISYIMLTQKKTAEEALKFLGDFIK